MSGFARIVAVFAALALAVPGLASGQQTGGQTTPPAAPAIAPAASGPAPGAAPAAAPEASADAAATPAVPKVAATGYGWSPPKAARPTGAARTTVHRAKPRATGPIATLPGFEMLGDGSSRMFVQLTQQVPVEEKKAAGTVVYVLKGAHIDKRNNQNALVTVHFNTPVSRARLVPVGNDLHFIVEMRSNVEPRWKLETAKDNSALFYVDFPKGQYVPNAPVTQFPPAQPSVDGQAN